MLVDNIRARAEALGMTLSQVESKAGLSRKTIYKWGVCSPSIEKALRVASVLGCTVEEMMFGKNDEEKH